MIKKYVSRYAESTKLSKKQILESAKKRLSTIKESLKKLKEEDMQPEDVSDALEKTVDDLEGILVDVISTVGAENPVTDTIMQAVKDVDLQAEIENSGEEILV
jgi:CII-binding regulator of phage lambda lysogenization HflD